MKIVGRILYAMLAVFVFWFAIDYARGRMEFLYFSEKGQEALDLNDDAFFYGSGRDYHYQNELFSGTFESYTITLYEAADATIEEDVLNVETYIYGILHDTQELQDLYHVDFIADDSVLEVQVVKFREFLNIGMMTNDIGDQYGIAKEAMFTADFHTLSISDANDNEFMNIPFELNESSFVLEDVLTNYYETNESLPVEELTDQAIYPRYVHTLEPYMHVLYISIAVYVVAVGLSFYILFILRRKHLGKKKPSIYFKKEQQKYIDQDNKKE